MNIALLNNTQLKVGNVNMIVYIIFSPKKKTKKLMSKVKIKTNPSRDNHNEYKPVFLK